MLNIPKVVQCSTHILYFGLGRSTPTIYLCPARYARLDVLSYHVSAHHFLKGFVEVGTVRPWSYHRHLVEQYVDKLRYFVQVCLSNKPAYFGDT